MTQLEQILVNLLEFGGQSWCGWIYKSTHQIIFK